MHMTRTRIRGSKLWKNSPSNVYISLKSDLERTFYHILCPCFPSHSIFIQVATKAPIVNIAKELRGMQRLMKADPAKDPLFLTDPVISIGRKLLPWQYEKGWQEYRHRHFTSRFLADDMLFLKRKPGSKNYQVLQRLEFQNLPVSTRQGALFV